MILFTGEMGQDIDGFIGFVISYRTRVAAYLWLLTDSYPPYSQGFDLYPVRLQIRASRYNRISVLFRLILVLPILFLSFFLGIGVSILSIISWITALFVGRIPTSFHDGVAVVLRLRARTAGYLQLVTNEYPWGIFGDKSSPAPSGQPTLPRSGAVIAIVIFSLLIGIVAYFKYLSIASFYLI